MTALNPVYTVGDQIMEAIMVHNPDISKKEARERAIEMLKWLVYQLLKRGWMTIHTNVGWYEAEGYDSHGSFH